MCSLTAFPMAWPSQPQFMRIATTKSPVLRSDSWPPVVKLTSDTSGPLYPSEEISWDSCLGLYMLVAK